MTGTFKLPSGSALVSCPWHLLRIYQPSPLSHIPATTPHELGACLRLGRC